VVRSYHPYGLSCISQVRALLVSSSAASEYETHNHRGPPEYRGVNGRTPRETPSRACGTSARRAAPPPQDPERRGASRSLLAPAGEAVRPVRIGSRGSLLAKWQAEFVRKQLFHVTNVE